MRRFLLTLLAVVIVLGVLAGIGFAGYRYGYMQGATGDGAPFVRGDGFGWHRMPMHDFERGIGPRFHGRFGGFNMLGHGGFGFGFFSPLRLLFTLAFWGLVIWLGYKLLTGWRLTLVQPNQPAPAANKPEPAPTDNQNPA